MKILFINPGYSFEELYGDLAKAGNELPPQNIAGLAAVTRNHGFITSILDCAVTKIDLAATKRKISEISPDYVGITSTTVTVENAFQIASGIKQILPSVKIIMGGPHITALPKETLEMCPAIDVGIVGEGEDTLTELLSFDNKSKPLKEIYGIVFRDHEGKIIRTADRNLIVDIDKLPFPAWDLLPPLDKFYRPPGDSINRMPAAGLVTSRGCPGRCTFCDNRTFGRKFRSHGATYVTEMIKDLVVRCGVKEIYFQDDHFMASRKRLREICDSLIEENINLTWTCTGRISKSINPEILSLMKRAGCWQVCYGIESGSQEILNIIKKDIYLDDIRRCVKMTRKAGLSVKGFFMLGNFKETEETVNKTIKFIKELPLTDFHMCYFVPFPGSSAYNDAQQYGKFDKHWRSMNLYFPKSFVPHGFTEERIEELFRKCYRAHYLKPSVILYFAKKIRNLAILRKLLVSLMAFMVFSFSNKKQESTG